MHGLGAANACQDENLGSVWPVWRSAHDDVYPDKRGGRRASVGVHSVHSWLRTISLTSSIGTDRHRVSSQFYGDDVSFSRRRAVQAGVAAAYQLLISSRCSLFGPVLGMSPPFREEHIDATRTKT